METRAHRPAASLLFIRSVPVPMAQAVLARLRRAYPDATVTALTSPASARPIEETEAVDEIQAYRSSRFGLRAAGARLLFALRRRRFDYVIVPTTGAHWLPFWNVGRVALAIGGRTAVWLPCDRTAETIDLDRCLPISVHAWRRSASVSTRLRALALTGLKWPLLTVFYGVSMILLAILALVLLPLVWLKPDPESEGPCARVR